MALRVTVSFSYTGGSICGEIVGMNMGHAVLADKELSMLKCEPCEIAMRYGAVIVGGKICEDKALIVLIANTFQLSRILKEMHELGLKPRVVGRAKYIKEPDLTEDQLRLIELAYKLGYFDESRKVSLKDLASMIGVSPSAADRKLRRGLKKIVEFYLSRYGRGDHL
ncbi:helix-turn-helix domain-containing protein [Pyrobaculum ferrireducens]|uniref:Bacterio-opsin activator n=1 Tax=Pyrobaculum ferrireducens TaxID=1104324 RepID=G7VCH7_9CREN|nr:helix-turn-helix domain-containing protein [Pyrobaculum ferrireducens]AET32597.1 Bacterio-opsin activator [Pyrobaculum ferrireducens]